MSTSAFGRLVILWTFLKLGWRRSDPLDYLEGTKMAKEKEDGAKRHRISVSAPWGDRCIQSLRQVLHSDSELVGGRFLQERSRVHEAFIRETEKTKRLGFGLAAALLALACIVPIFAPEGRETASWWVSAALFVFSAGSMGYTTIWLKMKKREMKLTKS
jgi:hypothetical protein